MYLHKYKKYKSEYTNLKRNVTKAKNDYYFEIDKKDETKELFKEPINEKF